MGLPISKEINNTNMSGIKTVFNGIFVALDHSSFFSIKPHVMSNFRVAGSPTLQDINELLGPLLVRVAMLELK